MVKVFISYSRESQEAVKALAEDVRDASHDPWFDEKLTGGQHWWDSILEQLRKCDAFFYALTPDSLESEACRREFRYAQQLGKPLVPVRLSEQVKPQYLPNALGEIHCVDYWAPGSKSAYKSLDRALRNLPPAPTLPDPLPQPPKVPVSYVVALRERIEADSLDQKEQGSLVFELRSNYRSGRPGAEIALLLDRLKRREDLYAKVEREIDTLLAEIQQGSEGGAVRVDLTKARSDALERIRNLCVWRYQRLLHEARDTDVESGSGMQQRVDATDPLVVPSDRIGMSVPVVVESASSEAQVSKTARASASAGRPPRKRRPAGDEASGVPATVERIPKSLRLDDAPMACERVMRRVAACGECWVFEIDQHNAFELSLDDSEPHCFVATATLRDTVTEPASEALKALGWEVKEHSFAKGAAGAAAVYATGGLAALALLSKGVRDMLMSFEATRSWPVPRSGALARPASEFALAVHRVAKDVEAIRVRRKKDE